MSSPHNPMATTTSVVARRIALGVAALGASLAGVPAAGQEMIHVDDDAPPGGDGRSWDTALRTIHEALELAQSIPSWERTIAIAEGTYFVNPGGEPEFAFQPSSGVTFRGGWGRSLEADRNTGAWIQDPARFVTVIDGASGPPGPSGDSEVLIRPRPDTFVTCEGIRFRNARTSAIEFGPAGGVTLLDCRFEGLTTAQGVIRGTDASSLWIERCAFVGNRPNAPTIDTFQVEHVYVTDSVFISNHPTDAWALGGAIHASQPRVINLFGCRFEDNRARSAGAVWMDRPQERAEVTACTFVGNAAHTRDAGALLIQWGDAPARLELCTFESNTAARDTGAVAILSTNTARVQTCLFVGNTAARHTGALDAQSADVTGCTLVGNRSGTDEAGALRLIWNSSLTNSILWDNTTALPAPSLLAQQLVAADARIEDNIIAGGDGDKNLAIDPRFVGAGDYSLRPDSPAINLGNRGDLDDWLLLDLAFKPRITGAFVDAGCYEADSPQSCDTADLSTHPHRGQLGYRLPDGRITTDDLFTYLDAYARGNASADLTRTTIQWDPYFGVPDGIISHTDLYYYLMMYERGCP